MPTLPVHHPHKIMPRPALGLRLWASYLTPLSLGLLGCEMGVIPRSGAGLGVSLENIYVTFGVGCMVAVHK